MTPDLFAEFNRFVNPSEAGPPDLERLMEAVTAPRENDEFEIVTECRECCLPLDSRIDELARIPGGWLCQRCAGLED